MLLNPDDEQEEAPLLQQARQLLAERKAAEAAQMMKRYLYYSPGAASDYELLGVSLAMAGDGPPAIAALEQAQGLDRNSPTIAYNLGHVYRQAGRFPEAITAFERAIKLRPDYDAAKRALQATVQQAQQAPPAPAGSTPPRS
jgi:tetratricopeptide (TPR) repeat protein